MVKMLIFASWMSSWVAFAENVLPPVTTVLELNIEQYLGKWYQIASIPAWFQRNCAKNTTAVYSKVEDGLLQVENSCENKNGETSTVIGRAKINQKLHSPSKLEVTFFNILGHWFWTFGGNYWVMEVGSRGDIYEYSVVGDPTRKYLWILARKPQLTLEEVKPIRDQIKAQFYDLDKIIVTQTGDLNGKKLSDLE
jgi:apolipoprotein D and lipocalin family protein